MWPAVWRVEPWAGRLAKSSGESGLPLKKPDCTGNFCVLKAAFTDCMELTRLLPKPVALMQRLSSLSKAFSKSRTPVH